MKWGVEEISDLMLEIQNRTFAGIDEIKNVMDIMDHFLSGFSGSPASAVRHLEKMKHAMFVEISEKDWAEWLRKDFRRAKYIDKAMSIYEIKTSKELMDVSYFLFIRDIYDTILSRLKAKAVGRRARAETRRRKK